MYLLKALKAIAIIKFNFIHYNYKVIKNYDIIFSNLQSQQYSIIFI